MKAAPSAVPYQLTWPRVWLVIIVPFVALLWLLYFLYDLQWQESDFLVREGNRRILRNFSSLPARGLITDRNGVILAVSVPVKEVAADPKIMHEAKIMHQPDLIRKIASLINLSPQELFARLQDPKRRYVKLNSAVELDQAEELAALKIPGLQIEDSYKRYYPTGEVNAGLVGMLNADGRGIYGVEQSFNSYLTALSSTRAVHKDSTGHIVENLGVLREGKSGGNLMLSVDDRLQAIAYDAMSSALNKFGADAGTLVLMDVKTGEVLAAVSVPSFDPNDRTVFDGEKAKNRMVTDVFEPGSTLKPLVSLAALEHGTVSWTEVVDTGRLVVDGKEVRDTHAMGKGSTLADLLKYSSNIGMARIAMRTGPGPIMDMLQRFGLGSRTSSGLSGEVAGMLRADRPFWAEIDKATLGYGYGITVTALQLTSAYATLANFGARVPVSILRLPQAPTPVQVASAAEIRRMHQVLETVVEGGTGSRAAIDRYRIAGKTGTALIASRGGYTKKQYTATFAGFAPLSAPRFAMVVSIRNPSRVSYSGGVVSGPVFRDVMTRALQLYNVPPDK